MTISLQRRDRLAERQRARRAALSGFFGSALEYYDFLIYGSASALIFSQVFFAGAGDAATLVSVATFGVAYIARPIGAVLWGHVGDRYGRRRALVLTIATMGIATFAIGLLPTPATIGIAAPLALIALRLLQGLSAGGESPGSTALAIEHSPDGRRAFYASFTMSGMQLGIASGSLVFLPLIALLPTEALLAWGWRVPFLLSGVLTVVAFVLRRKLEEPDTFTAMASSGARAEVPLFYLFRHHWITMARVLCMSSMNILGTLFNVFVLSYGASNGISSTVLLAVVSLANLVAVPISPVAGILADRFGRRPVFIIGSLASAVCGAVLFSAVADANIPLMFASGTIGMGIFYAMAIAVAGAYYPELFPAQVRYTGMAIALMLGILVSGFAPAIAEALGGGASGSWLPAAMLCAATGLISAAAALLSPETGRLSRAQLEQRGN